MLLNQFIMNTSATNDVGVWRGCGHLEGQAIGPLEGVAVPDKESAWFLVLQNSNGWSPIIRKKKKKKELKFEK